MSESQKTKQLSDRAAKFYEAMEDLDIFQKRDVVAILSTFVELELRRNVIDKTPKK